MSPTAPSHQGVHPSTSGNIIRAALAFESVVTVGVGSYFMFFPRHYLLRTMGAAASQVTTTALQMTQQYGAANILVGVGVGLFMSNTQIAIESRQILYRTVLVFELSYIPLLVWQAFMMDGGMPQNSLLVTAGQFVPFVVWRIFTLCCKPVWFGRYQERKKVE
ncbi:uncharacterized protein ALTATR162_LOCUS3652 [Alternaria atra]|uniref:Uncharacterized protein n=1 Tax=Alternaria atra TaxID=119953 RepID=A0A8J2I142_9PLEO|nr:uncharacterized protein ALTATR162_LOCUS3652 [Alternaria atra]CAG5155417.1 unnamed protein product [Alternaria atra]